MLKKNLIKILNIFKSILTKLSNLNDKFIYVLKKHVLPDKKHYPYENYLNKKVFHLYEDEQVERSYKTYRKYFDNAVFLNYWDLKKYSLKKSLENDTNQKKFYLEFGVLGGGTINLFSQFLKTEIYGFDSFIGLREDMKGADHVKGDFDLEGKVPFLKKNVIPVKGWVQDTLPKFLEEKKPLINFVHMDLDTYESTKFVLTSIKKYLDKNCVIIFDDFYNFAGWEVGENKAFNEVFEEDEFNFLAFSKFDRTVSIKYIGKK